MIFIIKATITLLSVLHFSVSFRSQSWKIRSYDLFKKGPSHLILHALPKSKQPGSNLPDLSQSRFPDIPDNGYDLVIIGSGPAGEAAAVRAAQLGARVAVVEKK
jgi:FAD binding domain